MGHDVEDRPELFDAALRRAGVLQMIAAPRMPATPRDRRPCGLTKRIASAIPGASRSITMRVPSGVWSRGANPVPPVVTIRPANPSVISDSAVGDGVGAVLGDVVGDDVEPGSGELVDERRAAGVLARAGDDTVADREDLGLQRCRPHGDARSPSASLIAGRRYRAARRSAAGRRWRSRATTSPACPRAARSAARSHRRRWRPHPASASSSPAEPSASPASPHPRHRAGPKRAERTPQSLAAKRRPRLPGEDPPVQLHGGQRPVESPLLRAQLLGVGDSPVCGVGAGRFAGDDVEQQARSRRRRAGHAAARRSSCRRSAPRRRRRSHRRRARRRRP